MENNLNDISLLPIFYGIKKEDLLSMFKCLGAYSKIYSKNELIYIENQKIRYIGIILSGKVHMVKEDINGNKSIVLCLEEGEIFGETFACGNDLSSSVTFIANKKCNIIFIPFHKVIHSCKMTCTFHHRLIENMVNLISRKNILLMNKIDAVSKKNLRDKILTYLYSQSELFKNNEFTIPLGRVELADYLCTDRSALTRELNNMKEEGIIDFHKNFFKIFYKK